MGAARVVVRRARAGDAPARLRLLAECLHETQYEAFLYFYFQELTLQCVVLSGAVLFIFCGVSVAGCLLVLPASAAAVWLAVWLHTLNAVNNLTVQLREEVCGWVAELSGPLVTGRLGEVQVLQETDEEYDKRELTHRELVGTVSLCAARGVGGGAGWVRALCVRGVVRRRGAGRALLAALCARAAADGLGELHAATSQLQQDARAMLHALGWECRGTYHRPLLGAALTLPMAHLARPLPHA